MNKLMKATLSTLLFLLSGCATNYQPAPAISTLALQVGNIRIVNDQAETMPRVFFTDGIISIKTEYRGWTGNIVNKFEKWISTSSIKSASEKTLSLSLQSIACNGHFIRSCSISLLILKGDGTRKIYTTDPYAGYTDALEKAIDGGVELALADADLLNYLQR